MKYKLKYHLKSGKIYEKYKLTSEDECEKILEVFTNNTGRIRIDLSEVHCIQVHTNNIDFIEVESTNDGSPEDIS